MFIRSIRAIVFGVMLTFGASTGWAMGDDNSSKSKGPPGDYELGLKEVKAGNFALALPFFQKVVAKDSGNADAWNYVGYSHRKLKRYDQALTAYKKALAIKPDHRGANEYIGELYLETGKLALAKERLKVLDSACFFGCEEYDELKAAIAAYEAKIN